MLSGATDPFGAATEEMLEKAEHNLTHELMSFGLSEAFDESLVLTKWRLGLRTVLLQRGEDEHSPQPSAGRVNPNRPRGDEIPREMRRSAEECNQYDLELYRYAQQVFDRAPERSELEFKIEVAALSAAQPPGDIDLSVSAPDGYSGDETSWRLLLAASALSLRHERELAAVSAVSQEITQHGDDVLSRLAELSSRHLDEHSHGEATRDLADMVNLLRRSAAVSPSAGPATDSTHPRAKARRAAPATDARTASRGPTKPQQADLGGDANGTGRRPHKSQGKKRRRAARRSPSS
jgi:hypothetical protein